MPIDESVANEIGAKLGLIKQQPATTSQAVTAPTSSPAIDPSPLYKTILDGLVKTGVINPGDDEETTFAKLSPLVGDHAKSMARRFTYGDDMNAAIRGRAMKRGAEAAESMNPLSRELLNVAVQGAAGYKSAARGVQGLFVEKPTLAQEDIAEAQGFGSKSGLVSNVVGGALPYLGSAGAGLPAMAAVGGAQAADVGAEYGMDRAGRLATGIAGGGLSLVGGGLANRGIQNALASNTLAGVAKRAVADNLGGRVARIGINAASGAATGLAATAGLAAGGLAGGAVTGNAPQGAQMAKDIAADSPKQLLGFALGGMLPGFANARQLAQGAINSRALPPTMIAERLPELPAPPERILIGEDPLLKQHRARVARDENLFNAERVSASDLPDQINLELNQPRLTYSDTAEIKPGQDVINLPRDENIVFAEKMNALQEKIKAAEADRKRRDAIDAIVSDNRNLRQELNLQRGIEAETNTAYRPRVFEDAAEQNRALRQKIIDDLVAERDLQSEKINTANRDAIAEAELSVEPLGHNAVAEMRSNAATLRRSGLTDLEAARLSAKITAKKYASGDKFYEEFGDQIPVEQTGEAIEPPLRSRPVKGEFAPTDVSIEQSSTKIGQHDPINPAFNPGGGYKNIHEFNRQIKEELRQQGKPSIAVDDPEFLRSLQDALQKRNIDSRYEKYKNISPDLTELGNIIRQRRERGATINPAYAAGELIKKGYKAAGDLLTRVGPPPLASSRLFGLGASDAEVAGLANRASAMETTANNNLQRVENRIIGGKASDVIDLFGKNKDLFARMKDDLAALDRAGIREDTNKFVSRYGNEAPVAKQMLEFFARGNKETLDTVSRLAHDKEIELQNAAPADKKPIQEQLDLLRKIETKAKDRLDRPYISGVRTGDEHLVATIKRGKKTETVWRSAHNTLEEAQAKWNELSGDKTKFDKEIGSVYGVKPSDVTFRVEPATQHMSKPEIQSARKIIEQMNVPDDVRKMLYDQAGEAVIANTAMQSERPSQGIPGYERDALKVVRDWIPRVSRSVSKMEIAAMEKDLFAAIDNKLTQMRLDKSGKFNRDIRFLEDIKNNYGKNDGSDPITKASRLLRTISAVTLLGANIGSTGLQTLSFATSPLTMKGLSIAGLRHGFSNSFKAFKAMGTIQALKPHQTAVDVIIDNLPNTGATKAMREALLDRRESTLFTSSDPAITEINRAVDGGGLKAVAGNIVDAAMYGNSRVNSATRVAAWMTAYEAYQKQIGSSNSKFKENMKELGYTDMSNRPEDFADFVVRKTEGDYSRAGMPLSLQKMKYGLGQAIWQMKQFAATQSINQLTMLARSVKGDTNAIKVLLGMSVGASIAAGVQNSPFGATVDWLIKMATLRGKSLKDIIGDNFLTQGIAGQIQNEDIRNIAEQVANRGNFRPPDITGTLTGDIPAVSVAANIGSGIGKGVEAIGEASRGNTEAAKDRAQEAFEMAAPSTSRVVEAVTGGPLRKPANAFQPEPKSLKGEKSLGDRLALGLSMRTAEEQKLADVSKVLRDRPWKDEVDATISEIAQAAYSKRPINELAKHLEITLRKGMEQYKNASDADKPEIAARLELLKPDAIRRRLREELYRLSKGAAASAVKSAPKQQREAASEQLE